MRRDGILVCVCVYMSVDVRLLGPGSYSTNPQGTKGRTGLGLERTNAVSLSLTGAFPVCEKYSRAEGNEERDPVIDGKRKSLST